MPYGKGTYGKKVGRPKKKKKKKGKKGIIYSCSRGGGVIHAS